MVVGPAVDLLEYELASVVRLDPLRHQVPSQPDRLQSVDHIDSPQRLAHHDGKAFPTAVIDYGQRPESAAVKQRVAHKIHAPYLVQTTTHRAFQAVGARFEPARTLGAKVQPLLPVQTIHPLVVVCLAFPPQLDVDATATISNARDHDFPDAIAQGGIVPASRPIVVHRGANKHQRRAPSHRDAVVVHQVMAKSLALHGSQSFFFSTSCSICLSRLRSATICLSLAFSSLS
jgi:hypothetical protein